jgi:hypothetical protein
MWCVCTLFLASVTRLFYLYLVKSTNHWLLSIKYSLNSYQTYVWVFLSVPGPKYFQSDFKISKEFRRNGDKACLCLWTTYLVFGWNLYVISDLVPNSHSFPSYLLGSPELKICFSSVTLWCLQLLCCLIFKYLIPPC